MDNIILDEVDFNSCKERLRRFKYLEMKLGTGSLKIFIKLLYINRYLREVLLKDNSHEMINTFFCTIRFSWIKDFKMKEKISFAYFDFWLADFIDAYDFDDFRNTINTNEINMIYYLLILTADILDWYIKESIYDDKTIGLVSSRIKNELQLKIHLELINNHWKKIKHLF